VRSTNVIIADDVARNMLLFFSTTLHPIDVYYQTVIHNIKELAGSGLAESTNDSILYHSESNGYGTPFVTEEKLEEAFESKAMFVGRVDPKQSELITVISERITS